MAKRGAIALALGGACLGAQANAQDAQDVETPPPDLEFLEYLGSWQGEDDEWFVIEQWEKDNAERRQPKTEAEDRRRKPQPENDERGE